MRGWLFGLLLLMTACSVSKESSSVLHSVHMHNRGSEIYDFRIQYGDTILPFGNGDPEFGAGGIRVYSGVMPLPERAIVEWRAMPAPEGRPLRFYVPLRTVVSQEEWSSQFFTVKFSIDNGHLEVHAYKDPTEPGRLIYSKTTDPAASSTPI